MNERDRDRLEEQQRLAREAVRGLPRPEADADFRARLKDRFVSGAIDDGATDLAPLDSPPTAGAHLGRVWLGWTGLAAAAVVAAALLGFNRLPGPQLVAATGQGSITVAGREVAAHRTEVIGDLLKVGARVQVGEGVSLDLVYPGSFVMRLDAGTDLVLPERPGRWFRRTVEAPMTRGELSVRTGPDLRGGGLIVRTDEGRAVIHGTLVSVFRNDELTCVCLFEGSARILSPAADLGDLPVGKRWVLFRDGSEPALMDIMPAHRDHMLGLDEALGGIFDEP